MTKLIEIFNKTALATTTSKPKNHEEALDRMYALLANTDLLLGTEDSYKTFYESWLPKVAEMLTLMERNQRNQSGKQMVDYFYETIQKSIKDKVEAVIKIERTRSVEVIEKQQLHFMFGGDESMFEFYKELVNFDWWYSYSDDNTVYAAGRARQAALYETAVQKGEAYVKLYNHVQKNVSKF